MTFWEGMRRGFIAGSIMGFTVLGAVLLFGWAWGVVAR